MYDSQKRRTIPFYFIIITIKIFKMKNNLIFTLLFLTSSAIFSQELKVMKYDSIYKNVIGEETFVIGDLVVVGHTKNKGKLPHYFQGKITGIFKNRGVIRILDYARSTRVMPIAGKKIKVDEIVAIARPDEQMMKGRNNRAIAAAGGKFLGSMIGGKTGDAIHLGSSVGNVISDFVSREQLNYQRIKCEIIEY